MFKRRTSSFEITEHPEVIAALNAMAEDWYQRGRRDALEIVKDFRSDAAETAAFEYLDGLDGVIEKLEI